MYGADASFARAQREYDNAGPPEADEVEMERTCGEKVDCKVLTPEAARLVARLREWTEGKTPRGVSLEVLTSLWIDVRQLTEAVRTTEQIEITCPFEGEVTVYVMRESGMWECPACGTEHNEVIPDDRP